MLAILRRRCLPALALVLAAPASAQLISPQGWTLMRTGGAATMQVQADASGPQGVQGVLRISVSRPSEPFYGLQAVQPIVPDIPAGHRLRFTFWARSASRNPLRADVEKTAPPYTAVVDLSPVLTPEWKRYTGAGPTPGFGPNGMSVHFQVGHQAGEVEIAGVTLEDIGPDPQVAAAAEAVKPAAVQERIRRYRMGTLRVKVVDERGRTVPGATVSVEQTRHAFLFGCNIFALNPEATDPLQKEYQERFTTLFNFATLPFYWGGFEPEQGQPQYARLDAMDKWCREHGLVTKGHPLVWHEVWPRWAPKDPDAAIPLLRQRVLDILKHYAGRVTYWDVLNEANAAASYGQTGEGAWVKRDGPARVVSTALRWARDASKGQHNTLIYNDYNTGEQNVQLLQELKGMGVLPDAIGIQSHMHGAPWPIEQVWATAERFSQFGRPVHFTETTVISGAIRPFDMSRPPSDWDSTPEGEKRQADYVERFYSVLFSHPNVLAITYWDLSDRSAWVNAPAGYLRKDMSPKPAYDRLLKLIKGDWWTRAHGVTADRGTYETRAFYGDYRIVARDDQGHVAEQPVSLPMGSGSREVTVKLR